jgi:hypothetical protein
VRNANESIASDRLPLRRRLDRIYVFLARVIDTPASLRGTCTGSQNQDEAMIEQTREEYYYERYCAFVDILGFASLVEGLSGEK